LSPALSLGRDLLNQAHQCPADIRAIDPGKRLHKSKRLGLRQLIEYGAPRRIVRPIGSLEEIRDLHSEGHRDFQQSAAAYPIGALLVFLNLLERYAECIRELRL
jgi:hypothetical protein